MKSDPPPAPSRSDDAGPPLTLSGCLKPLGIVLSILAACGLLLTGVLVGRCSSSEPPATPASADDRGPDVLMAIRELGRLEGSSFYLERVIDLADEQHPLAELLQTENAMLLVVGGEVVAGVDLSQLEERAVQSDHERGVARIQLPRAKVLSARLANEHAYVYTPNAALLARRQESLARLARQQAERTLEDGAIEAGLLEDSEENVTRIVESLLRSLGYSQVDVRFETKPAR